MREYKFRGKPFEDVDFDEINVHISKDDFVYGNLIVDGKVAYIVNGIVEVTEGYLQLEQWIHVRPETVGQFTGLPDKNGIEIYDGDIVAFENKWEWYRGSFPEWHSMTHEERIAWVDKQPMYQYVIEYHAVEGYSSQLSQHYIVIGNIHDKGEVK